jgi:hypothetical protein
MQRLLKNTIKIIIQINWNQPKIRRLFQNAGIITKEKSQIFLNVLIIVTNG